MAEAVRRPVNGRGAAVVARRVSRLRTAAQVTSSALFLALFTLAALGLTRLAVVPVELYFLADPLLASTAMVTAGTLVVAPLVVAGLLLVVTALFGRVFCGALCPLGACLDWTAPRSGSKGARRAAAPGTARAVARWRWLKYALLAALVVAAVARVPLAFLADPLAILWRALALAVQPLLLAAAGLGLDGARAAADHLTTTTPLAVTVPQRIFSGAAVSVVLLGVILAANRFVPRLWCRVACPLGALLSLVGARPWLRRSVDGASCLSCTSCRKSCPLGALADGPEGSDPSECLVCMRCADACPTGSVSLAFVPPWRRLARRAGSGSGSGSGSDLGFGTGPGGNPSPLPVLTARPAGGSVSAPGFDRRRFLGRSVTVAACAVGGALVLDRMVFASGAAGGTLRPPGSLAGDELLDRCVRCGVCMQACPTNAIQPDLSPAGLTGLFAPEMVMRLGGCDPECTRCGQVCPTGAIAPLTIEEKRSWVIGTAVVEAERCLRTRSAVGGAGDGGGDGGQDCRACLEVCPYEAFETGSLSGLAPGRAPRVIADRCTGCGLCELRCPVPPRDASRRARRQALRGGASVRAAIRVLTIEEAARLAPALETVPDRGDQPRRDDSHLPLFLRGS